MGGGMGACPGGGGGYAGIPPDMGSGLGARPGGWGGIAIPVAPPGGIAKIPGGGMAKVPGGGESVEGVEGGRCDADDGGGDGLIFT